MRGGGEKEEEKVVVVGGQGAVQLRRHERHHVMKAEHAGFMGASRMDVQDTRTTQRNAWNGSRSRCCHFCFPLCSILALERRDSWEAEEESVCSECMFGRGGGGGRVGSESAQNKGMECVLCVCVWKTGKQATHRNGILLKQVRVRAYNTNQNQGSK